MYPEKRNYTASGNVMTESAIDSGLTRDLYVSLGEPLNNGAWSVRVYYKAVDLRLATGVMRWQPARSVRPPRLNPLQLCRQLPPQL